MVCKAGTPVDILLAQVGEQRFRASTNFLRGKRRRQEFSTGSVLTATVMVLLLSSMPRVGKMPCLRCTRIVRCPLEWLSMILRASWRNFAETGNPPSFWECCKRLLLFVIAIMVAIYPYSLWYYLRPICFLPIFGYRFFIDRFHTYNHLDEACGPTFNIARFRTSDHLTNFKKLNTEVCEQWHASVDLLTRHVRAMSQLRYMFTLQVNA